MSGSSGQRFDRRRPSSIVMTPMGAAQIEREEAVAAVNDYFDDLITRDQVIRVIQAYLSS